MVELVNDQHAGLDIICFLALVNNTDMVTSILSRNMLTLLSLSLALSLCACVCVVQVYSMLFG